MGAVDGGGDGEAGLQPVLTMTPSARYWLVHCFDISLMSFFNVNIGS